MSATWPDFNADGLEAWRCSIFRNEGPLLSSDMIRAASTLFEVEPVTRPATSRALVPIDRAACPSCAGQVTTVTLSEPTLFRHGGHGATRRTTSRLCVASLAGASSCRWGLTVDVTETSPRTAGP